jgi:hypothetical protein
MRGAVRLGILHESTGRETYKLTASPVLESSI